MRPLALLIEYDGTNYAGWQNQPNGTAVQEVIEGAITEAFGVRVPVVGSGRTDAGVHARGQVAHVHLPDEAHDIPTEKVRVALNTRLPRDIRIRRAAEVDEQFHARYDPEWREYVYDIAPEESVFTRHFAWTPDLPYDVDNLVAAASIFEGERDFTSFSKHNPDTSSYICNVHICRVEPGDGVLTIRIRADRFVYGMCRSIVGAMMAVARGRMSPDEILNAFDQKDRNLQPGLAPAHGLILNHVRYPNGLFEDASAF